MQLLEIVISYIIGGLLILTVAFVLSIKTKGIFRVLVNTLFGGIILMLFNIFNVAYFPLNPLNALIVGVLGVPGLAVIFLLLRVLS